MFNKRPATDQCLSERFECVVANNIVNSYEFVEQLRRMTAIGGQCHLVDVEMGRFRHAVEAIPRDLLEGPSGDGEGVDEALSWHIWDSAYLGHHRMYHINCTMYKRQRNYHWFEMDRCRQTNLQNGYIFAGGFMGEGYLQQSVDNFKIFKALIRHPRIIKEYRW